VNWRRKPPYRAPASSTKAAAKLAHLKRNIFSDGARRSLKISAAFCGVCVWASECHQLINQSRNGFDERE